MHVPCMCHACAMPLACLWDWFQDAGSEHDANEVDQDRAASTAPWHAKSHALSFGAEEETNYLAARPLS